MKKLYTLKREGIFLVLAKHDVQLATFGTLFVSAFLTTEQANAINADFPATAFLA